jgi:hypothetical protein
MLSRIPKNAGEIGLFPGTTRVAAEIRLPRAQSCRQSPRTAALCHIPQTESSYEIAPKHTKHVAEGVQTRWIVRHRHPLAAGRLIKANRNDRKRDLFQLG